MIEYHDTKYFTVEQLEKLFISVGWFSGRFPDKLKEALENSSRVISAWDGRELVGLVRALDDGVWQATIDCLLVTPEYQRRGIAATLVQKLLAEYQDFLYVTVVPDEKKNVDFYQKNGFTVMEEATPLQVRGKSWQ